MRAYLQILLCLPLLQSCAFFQQRANHFESNSFIGYAKPATLNPPANIATGSAPLKIQDININKSDATGDLLEAGECIVVDLVDGFYNQNFETGLETIFGKSTTRNEVVLTTAIYERANSRALSADSSGKIQGAEYFIHNGNGQIARRPFHFENIPVYGPRPYNGGDITFEVTLLEKDKDEIKAVTEDIAEATSQVNAIIPSDQRKGLKDVASEVLNGATLSLTGAGYVAVGISAVELFNKAYKELNEEDDVIIRHSFALASSGRSNKTYQPYLREGYFPLIRISVEDTVKDRLQDATYDPLQKKLRTGVKSATPLWLVFRVSKVDTCGTK
ncbi:hypothetical protein OO258_25630 [Pseudomonas sp. DCB_BI]|uniref:hypothetical protein n=1 Tax=Pseudomonas sp. DCB_BI TaxID=2993594 RepID=UPI00224B5C48|nr:hypothetical protein [Pseudomonas sp. DCB_BI]MCX2891611.1 hypothetical protein [Pseudomonas sp. DCB_BI]